MHACRYSSRANIIPFDLPSVGPQCPDEQRAFSRLTAAINNGTFSQCIGWVVQQLTELEAARESQVMSTISTSIQASFISKSASRRLTGWSTLLFFTKQASNQQNAESHACMWSIFSQLLETCHMAQLYPEVESFAKKNYTKSFTNKFTIESTHAQTVVTRPSFQ